MLHRSLQFASQKEYNMLQRDCCSSLKKKKTILSCMTRAKNKTSNERYKRRKKGCNDGGWKKHMRSLADHTLRCMAEHKCRTLRRNINSASVSRFSLRMPRQVRHLRLEGFQVSFYNCGAVVQSYFETHTHTQRWFLHGRVRIYPTFYIKSHIFLSGIRDMRTLSFSRDYFKII